MRFTPTCCIALALLGPLVGNTACAQPNIGEIMRPGDPADCKGAPTQTLAGHWIALRQDGGTWHVAPTRVYIVNGKVHSSERAIYIIEVRKPDTPGSVRSTSISRHGDDFFFKFDGVDYQWVQAAGAHYYLTDGKFYWNGAWLKMAKASRPEAPKSNETHRCGYNSGCHELLWAGDINRDGNLDLIVQFNEGEDAGLQLWLGKRSGEEFHFQTAARGLYEYNTSFACTFREERTIPAVEPQSAVQRGRRHRQGGTS